MAPQLPNGITAKQLAAQLFVDFAESFAALVATQWGISLVFPSALDGADVFALQLLGAAATALLAAWRHVGAWGVIKAKLLAIQ